MYTRKINSFLRNFICGASGQKKYKSSSSESCLILEKYLGLNSTQAHRFIKNHTLENVNCEQLVENINLLSSFGYTNKDIIEYGNLIRRVPRRIQDQFLVLKESGFSNISPIILLSFRKLVHKKVRTLKTLDFIPKDLNVTNNLLNYINPKPSGFGFNFTDDDYLAEIQHTMLKDYLKWRLQATQDEIETFFRIYKYVRYKSFAYICDSIDFALSLGFEPRKLLRFGFVIVANPNFPKQILEEMPNLAGANMRIEMKRFPKLITVPPKNFRKIYQILQEYGISDNVIRNSMNIFAFSPQTVKERLDEIKHTPEMNVLRNNPRFLQIVIYHMRAKSRLTLLQQVQMKCFSMTLLGTENKKKFEDKIKDGITSNQLNDVINLLETLLQTKLKKAKAILRKHPYHIRIPLVEIEKTVKFLQKDFSNEAIVRVIYLVFYPVSKIISAIEQLQDMKNIPEKLTEERKLNLILYLLERDHHFTGDGVHIYKPDETE